MTDQTQARQLMKSFYSSMNNGLDIVSVKQLLSPDFVYHTGAATLPREPYITMLEAFQQGFSEFSVSCDQILSDGEWIAARVTVQGNHSDNFLGHSPTGRQFQSTGIDWFRTKRDQLSEAYGLFDTVSMLRQLGLYREVGT